MIEYIENFFTYKIVKYALIGGVSTLIHIILASLYIYRIEDSLFKANILGFIVAYLFSYIMQSLYVFNSKIEPIKALKYFLVQLSSLLVSIFTANILGNYNNYIKTVFVIIVMPLITYTIHKLWTFKEK